MKKFLIILVLVLAASASVFYAGWLQYQVDRNEIGVVHTRTVGYLPDPVIPGEFYWSPWRLLPGNVTLIRLPAAPETASVRHSGSLPSGSVYSYYIQGHPDFNYSLDMSVTYAVNPSHAVELTARENISEETYDAWKTRKSEAVRQRAVSLLLSKIEDIASSMSAGELPDLDIDKTTLTSDLEQLFPELTFHRISIDSLQLPDLALYVQARDSYYRTLETQQETLEQALEDLSVDRAELELYVQKLEKYGRLFTQYPALLEYLELHSLDSLP